jgi:hypothetical protein
LFVAEDCYGLGATKTVWPLEHNVNSIVLSILEVLVLRFLVRTDLFVFKPAFLSNPQGPLI